MHSIREMMGQMLMIGFRGTGPADPEVASILKQIEAHQIGGVLLFGHNVVSPQQLQELTTCLASAAPVGRPLLIAIDQEGGLVQRLRADKGFTDYPSADLVGKSGIRAAEETYQRLAEELRRYGFNLNFAPCVDLDRGSPPIYRRSYGKDPETVSDYAAFCIAAHRAAGVLTAIKHFPGHGSALLDTHRGLVDITATWTEDELVPFATLIGANKASMVMISHLVHRGFDPVNPLSLSPTFVQEHLRAKLRFDGVVVADDLHMGAIRQGNDDVPNLVRRALEADLDLLVFSNHPSASPGLKPLVPDALLGEKICALVEGLVATGAVSKRRLEQSFARIMELKGRLTHR